MAGAPVPGARTPALPVPFPSLPGSPPMLGAPAPLIGLDTSSLTWVAILTMLVALLASAHIRLGSTPPVPSGAFVSHVERPG